jgi:hypothetical protein
VQVLAQRGVRNEGNPKVSFWPDTFNNHFFLAVSPAAHSHKSPALCV